MLRGKCVGKVEAQYNKFITTICGVIVPTFLDAQGKRFLPASIIVKKESSNGLIGVMLLVCYPYWKLEWVNKRVVEER